MCHITYINKVDKISLNQFMYILESEGFTNNDGFGIFNPSYLYKQPDQFKVKMHGTNVTNNFGESDSFLIGHNRFKTHGNAKKRNTHPFSTQNLVYVHNGIIQNYKDYCKNAIVDSEVLGYLIEKELKENNGDIVKALKSSYEKLLGSFSVFVYYKPTKELYYIRHNADFTFMKVEYKDNNYIFGVTHNSQLHNLFNYYRGKKLYITKKELKEIEIEDDTIYKVTQSRLTAVAEIEPKKETYISKSISKYSEWYKDDPSNLYDDDLIIETEDHLAEYFGNSQFVFYESNRKGVYELLGSDVGKYIGELGYEENAFSIDDIKILNDYLIDLIEENYYKEYGQNYCPEIR